MNNKRGFMRSYINQHNFNLISDSLHLQAQRCIYHYPSIGKFGGWALSLMVNSSKAVVAIAGLAENIALGTINGAGSLVSNRAHSSFKINIWNIKLLAKDLLRFPYSVILNTIEYTRQPSENERLEEKERWRPCDFAIVYNDFSTFKKWLDENKWTLVMVKDVLPNTVNYNRIKFMKAFLQMAPKLQASDITRMALNKAIMMGNKQAIETLVEYGCDLNNEQIGRTPLHEAALCPTEKGDLPYDQMSCSEIITYLVKKGANPNARSNENATPLIFASTRENSEAIDALVRNGADLNAKDLHEISALHWAALSEKSISIETLVKYSQLDVNAQDQLGITALHIISSKNDSTSLIKIMKHGDLKPNLQDCLGRTALHCVMKDRVNEENRQKCEIFLRQIVDPNILDKEGKKADEYASN